MTTDAKHTPGDGRNVVPNFTPQMIALLGKRTDKKLARCFMMLPQEIARKRKELGIPSLRDRQRRKWTAEEIALLGTMSDLEVARRLGMSNDQARRMRVKQARAAHRKVHWTPEAVAMLGAMKDAEVAARLGISIHYIRQKRTKLGIKQFRPKRS